MFESKQDEQVTQQPVPDTPTNWKQSPPPDAASCRLTTPPPASRMTQGWGQSGEGVCPEGKKMLAFPITAQMGWPGLDWERQQPDGKGMTRTSLRPSLHWNVEWWVSFDKHAGKKHQNQEKQTRDGKSDTMADCGATTLPSAPSLGCLKEPGAGLNHQHTSRGIRARFSRL